MNVKPYSAMILAFAGLLLEGMGLYFIFLRPALLPQDLIYIGSSLQNVKEVIPGLLDWLPKVFWVLGSFIFTTGLLIVFIAFTSFRTRSRASFSLVALAGFSSIGSMTIINFYINSDFKWVLLAFLLPWVISLILYRLQK